MNTEHRTVNGRLKKRDWRGSVCNKQNKGNAEQRDN